MRDHASFGYRIRQTGEGWTWATLDPAGRVQARGRAPSKAVAAALVIRAIARSAVPDEAQTAA
ncbi:hypothetical protein [Phenylobacterium sp.]|jgi:hypothetical protein|uniref:hypothetical protein n=1 Tax=Phenylobacterium sp. TaxID=1871053 RepID=UPI002F94B49E